MKRVSSFIIAIITLISLTVPAFAYSNEYISDPEMTKQWNENWAEYDRLKAEKEGGRCRLGSEKNVYGAETRRRAVDWHRGN